ncbi:unnamed protein product [Rodentolepis nana]|uniref:Uncharacterized protein n=1 Tax=Rodentolepis nana TaxID=102285 RepID=A0A0R3T927_RODNA|nr:unnamed protein product [Rodentolepis nana]
MSLFHRHRVGRGHHNIDPSIHASDDDAADIVPSLPYKVVDPHRKRSSSSPHISEKVSSRQGQLELCHQLLHQFLQITPEASSSGHR